MDKYEIRIMILTGITLAIFLVSVLRTMFTYATGVPECIPYDESYTKPRIEKLDDKLYQIFALAQMWSFQPSEIRLPVGAEVDFYLTSKDVVHGFNVYDVSLNMMAVPGAINKETVIFDKPGVYKIICHEYCGSGHQHMMGEIIVNYPNK